MKLHAAIVSIVVVALIGGCARDTEADAWADKLEEMRAADRAEQSVMIEELAAAFTNESDGWPQFEKRLPSLSDDELLLLSQVMRAAMMQNLMKCGFIDIWISASTPMTLLLANCSLPMASRCGERCPSTDRGRSWRSFSGAQARGSCARP